MRCSNILTFSSYMEKCKNYKNPPPTVKLCLRLKFKVMIDIMNAWRGGGGGWPLGDLNILG